jgi:hypothetical protein
MRLRVTLAVTLAGLATIACGAVTGHAAVAGRTVTQSKPVVFGCANNALVEPGSYVLTCADYGSLLLHLAWRDWTGQQATATGVHELHDCTPSCAESAKFSYYPAIITFWRPEAVPGQAAEEYFSRVTVRYTTAQRPPMYMSYNTLLRNPAQWSEVLVPPRDR